MRSTLIAFALAVLAISSSGCCTFPGRCGPGCDTGCDAGCDAGGCRSGGLLGNGCGCDGGCGTCDDSRISMVGGGGLLQGGFFRGGLSNRGCGCDSCDSGACDSGACQAGGGLLNRGCGCDSGCATGCDAGNGGNACGAGCGCDSGYAAGCDSCDGGRGGFGQGGLLGRRMGGCSTGACGCGDCGNGPCGAGCVGCGNCGGGGGVFSRGGCACGNPGCGGNCGLMNGGLNLPALNGGYQGNFIGNGCADGSCSNAGMIGNGNLRGAVAGVAGMGGCGRFGCGMNGHLCLACRLRGLTGRQARLAADHPYGGQIPHTTHYPENGGQGSAAPTYAYPYYTTRGPRDFLLNNPPSIGW